MPEPMTLRREDQIRISLADGWIVEDAGDADWQHFAAELLSELDRTRKAQLAHPTLILTAEQLRALPVGTILADAADVAFQVETIGRSVIITPARLDGSPFWCKRDDNMADLLKHAPFRVLHTPEAAK